MMILKAALSHERNILAARSSAVRRLFATINTRDRTDTSLFDQYDIVGQVASLGDKCTFCKLISDDEEKPIEEAERVLYRDDHCVIFKDIRVDRATHHY